MAKGTIVTGLATAATAFLVSLVLTPLVRSWGRRRGVLDVPNVRSSHTVPTPRAGGIAIVAGIVFATVLGGGVAPILFPAALIALVSLIDDFRTVPAAIRFAVHAVAAAVAVTQYPAAALELAPGVELAAPLSKAFIFVWLIAATNLFNFMDGINGMASAQAVASGAVLALLLAGPDGVHATLAAAIAGASLGFLLFNQGGSIFMGDVGSAPLGFLLGALIVRLSGESGFVIAVLPFSPFVLDAGVTLARRIVRRERFFEAHRTHYYQRLVSTGWSHASVTGLWTLFALAGGVIAVNASRMSAASQGLAIVALIVSEIGAAAFVVTRERRARSGRNGE